MVLLLLMMMMSISVAVCVSSVVTVQIYALTLTLTLAVTVVVTMIAVIVALSVTAIVAMDAALVVAEALRGGRRDRKVCRSEFFCFCRWAGGWRWREVERGENGIRSTCDDFTGDDLFSLKWKIY